mmetsp:Transcript_11858/g.39013  ORF Transcript_11858/g.39013 Transcript_11858/m.39013 type:complete len:407 (+) Transcript_11858:2176-3396(+)
MEQSEVAQQARGRPIPEILLLLHQKDLASLLESFERLRRIGAVEKLAQGDPRRGVRRVLHRRLLDERERLVHVARARVHESEAANRLERVGERCVHLFKVHRRSVRIAVREKQLPEAEMRDGKVWLVPRRRLVKRHCFRALPREVKGAPNLVAALRLEHRRPTSLERGGRQRHGLLRLPTHQKVLREVNEDGRIVRMIHKSLRQELQPQVNPAPSLLRISLAIAQQHPNEAEHCVEVVPVELEGALEGGAGSRAVPELQVALAERNANPSWCPRVYPHRTLVHLQRFAELPLLVEHHALPEIRCDVDAVVVLAGRSRREVLQCFVGIAARFRQKRLGEDGQLLGRVDACSLADEAGRSLEARLSLRLFALRSPHRCVICRRVAVDAHAFVQRVRVVFLDLWLASVL